LNPNCQLQSPGPSASLVETGGTPEIIEGCPDFPEPAAEGDIQVEYSYDYVAQAILSFPFYVLRSKV
jgi:hypothetical protein